MSIGNEVRKEGRFCAEIISAFGTYRKVYNSQCFDSIKNAEKWADSIVRNAESWRIRDMRTNKIVKSLEGD